MWNAMLKVKKAFNLGKSLLKKSDLAEFLNLFENPNNIYSIYIDVYIIRKRVITIQIFKKVTKFCKVSFFNQTFTQVENIINMSSI